MLHRPTCRVRLGTTDPPQDGVSLRRFVNWIAKRVSPRAAVAADTCRIRRVAEPACQVRHAPFPSLRAAAPGHHDAVRLFDLASRSATTHDEKSTRLRRDGLGRLVSTQLPAPPRTAAEVRSEPNGSRSPITADLRQPTCRYVANPGGRQPDQHRSRSVATNVIMYCARCQDCLNRRNMVHDLDSVGPLIAGDSARSAMSPSAVVRT